MAARGGVGVWGRAALRWRWVGVDGDTAVVAPAAVGGRDAALASSGLGPRPRPARKAPRLQPGPRLLHRSRPRPAPAQRRAPPDPNPTPRRRAAAPRPRRWPRPTPGPAATPTAR